MPNSLPLALAAEWFTATTFLVLCLSHIFAAKAWSLLFQDAMKHPAAGLVIGYVTLVFGVLLMIARWRWAGDLRSIVTAVA